MSPPVAIEPNASFTYDTTKKLNGINGVNGLKQSNDTSTAEDYLGSYKFAPIRESEVSRAMIKRYFQTMYDRTISDVVIVGAGSAGLSCAYHLAKNNPSLKITIIEANVAPQPK